MTDLAFRCGGDGHVMHLLFTQMLAYLFPVASSKAALGPGVGIPMLCGAHWSRLPAFHEGRLRRSVTIESIRAEISIDGVRRSLQVFTRILERLR